MERLKIKTSQLTSTFVVDGVSLTSQFSNIEKFYGIPAALHNVDSKFKTTTYLDVVKAATPELNFLVDGTKLQLLDPKSIYMEDDKFDSVVELMAKKLKAEPKIKKGSFAATATIDLKPMDTDHFLKDAFARRWSFVRKPEGGVALTTDIVRLACTNGMMIPDKQYGLIIRKKLPDETAITQMHATAMLLNVEDYLQKLFTQDGEEISCSFADLLDMQACLGQLTDSPEYAEQLFPCQGVKEFYLAQGIETDKLARKWLDKLPTGLSYYQALQILTNGAKSMVEDTVENQLKVSRFCAPKRMQNMKQTQLHWEGTPKWTNAEIHAWMGDE